MKNENKVTVVSRNMKYRKGLGNKIWNVVKNTDQFYSTTAT